MNRHPPVTSARLRPPVGRARRCWNARPTAARWALTAGFALLVVGGGVAGLAAWLVVSSNSGLAGLAWLVALSVGATLPAAGLARIVGWLSTWAWFLRRDLCFPGEAPSRARLAWPASTARMAERSAATVLALGLSRQPQVAARAVVTMAAGVERHHPRERALAPLRRRAAHRIVGHFLWPQAASDAVPWALMLRSVAEVVAPERAAAWAASALPRLLPSGPVEPSLRRALSQIVEAADAEARAELGFGEAGAAAAPEAAIGRGARRVSRRWGLPDLDWRVAAPVMAVASALLLVGGVASLVETDDDSATVLGRVERPRGDADRAGPADDIVGAGVGDEVDIDVLANDPEGSQLEWFTQGAYGSVERRDDRLVYRRHSPGLDEFTYVVTLPGGDPAEATVIVTQPLPGPPPT